MKAESDNKITIQHTSEMGAHVPKAADVAADLAVLNTIFRK